MTYREASASTEENELRDMADAVEDLVSNASTYESSPTVNRGIWNDC